MKTRTWLLVISLGCFVIAELSSVGWTDWDHIPWVIAGLAFFVANRLEAERKP